MRHFFLGLALSMMSLSACAVVDVESVGSSEAQLRALEPSEIVGTIACGQTTRPIHYTETPRYRALTFQAAAGDRAKITVASPGIATLWILGSDFETKTSARASRPGSALTVEQALDTSGVHYVVLREADQEETDFTVTLERVSAQPDGGADGGGGPDGGADGGGGPDGGADGGGGHGLPDFALGLPQPPFELYEPYIRVSCSFAGGVETRWTSLRLMADAHGNLSVDRPMDTVGPNYRGPVSADGTWSTTDWWGQSIRGTIRGRTATVSSHLSGDQVLNCHGEVTF